METITLREDGDRWAISGALNARTLPEAEAIEQRLRQAKPRALDMRELGTLDTPGALFLCGIREAVPLTGVRAEHQALLDLICALELKPLPKTRSVPRWREVLMRLGAGAHAAGRDMADMLKLLGHAAEATATAFVRPSRLRLASISHQVAETGIHAMPIIGLLAVMISIVIAYQSVVQLRPYGLHDFTVNLVAVSVLREMGVLITAIMVAGRSGSAFTAEIGVMKAREEIDALNVMGLSPMELLILPRLIGLVIALPLLTFFADAMGLLGGALVTQFLLNVSPTQFFLAAQKAADPNDLLVGLIKAPIFAVIIAIVGCLHGMRVTGSAESVGRETTKAVVKSIFVVIVLDALFSIFFEKVGM